jgi:hypothetical protein
LDDQEVREFVGEAKEVVRKFGVSARISDFPAVPSVSTCRFCKFKSICPDYESFAEPDYSEQALSLAAEARARRIGEEALQEVGGEVRDIYLAHISQDKQAIVRPFARALESKGISYWLDEAEIVVGDSLSREINRGLAISKFVLCFLSEEFIERGWPAAEVGTALTEHVGERRPRLLPVFVADKATVLKEFPMLKDIVHADWSEGIEVVRQKLIRAMRKHRSKNEKVPVR